MKYILGLLASIALIVLVLVLVFRSFGRPPLESKEPLSDYASTNAMVSMTVQGPVVSEHQRVAYRVTVGRSEARLEALKGYEEEITGTRTFANNQESFYSFLRALDLAGFTRGDDNASEQERDERGVCATGRRYIFEITSGTSDIQRYWSASCRGVGTFKGNSASLKQLFDRQIPNPDFSQLTGPLGL